MSTQAENITRVKDAIGKTILEFRERVGSEAAFRCEALRDFVKERHPFVAPASPDRILRLLRRTGALDYVVVDRSSSLYQFK